MRTVYKATAIVAALGVAFGVSACGTDTKPGALPATTPKASASLSPALTPTAIPTQAPAAQGSQMAGATDSALKADLNFMATSQEQYIYDHPGKPYVAVSATKPGGRASLGTPNDVMTSRGNVIAVKVGPGWFCVSGYNKGATEAISATKSMLYRSDKGGIQADVGAC